MTTTLLYLNWLNLRRDYLALSLIFLLPIIFFTLYAVLFGSMGTSSGTSFVSILVADQDRTAMSSRFIKVLGEHGAFQVHTASFSETGQPGMFSVDGLTEQVRKGEFEAAVVVSAGFESHLQNMSQETMQPIELLYDAANPITRYMLADLLQSAAMAVKLDQFPKKNPKCASALVKPSSTAQEENGSNQASFSTKTAPQSICPGSLAFIPLKRISVRSGEVDPIAYYAAAVSMMFLLFAMSGAGGFLLEQQETGTLERLLNCNVGMGRLLIGSWLFFALVGMVQVAVTFLWGALFFGINLWTPNHLIGGIAITMLAALCASSFGIVLAVLCKSRAQLNGISTLVILMMSAIGGSMVPRFIMPGFMQKLSLLTINGWVLDGYSKVFSLDTPEASLLGSLRELWMNCSVLGITTALCLGCAYALSRRWETA